jgi:hypothetical protein
MTRFVTAILKGTKHTLMVYDEIETEIIPPTKETAMPDEENESLQDLRDPLPVLPTLDKPVPPPEWPDMDDQDLGDVYGSARPPHPMQAEKPAEQSEWEKSMAAYNPSTSPGEPGPVPAFNPPLLPILIDKLEDRIAQLEARHNSLHKHVDAGDLATTTFLSPDIENHRKRLDALELRANAVVGFMQANIARDDKQDVQIERLLRYSDDTDNSISSLDGRIRTNADALSSMLDNLKERQDIMVGAMAKADQQARADMAKAMTSAMATVDIVHNKVVDLATKFDALDKRLALTVDRLAAVEGPFVGIGKQAAMQAEAALSTAQGVSTRLDSLENEMRERLEDAFADVLKRLSYAESGIKATDANLTNAVRSVLEHSTSLDRMTGDEIAGLYKAFHRIGLGLVLYALFDTAMTIASYWWRS